MNLTDPTNARRALVSLLRHPEDWPEEFVWCWDKGYPSTFNGYTYGCGAALAEYTGIIDNSTDHWGLGISGDEYENIFVDCSDAGRNPSVIADKLEAVTS